MKRWSGTLNGLVLAVCLVAVIFCTVVEGRYMEVGKLIWPGASLSFIVFLVLGVKYFDHPTLATFMDVIFNTVIYWAIFLIARAVYLRVQKARNHEMS